jgi:DNA polymerase III delta subunit
MLKLFCGTDTIVIRSEVLTLLLTDAYNQNRTERLEGEEVTAARIADMTSSVSLFGEKTTYVIDTPSTHNENFLLLLESLAICQESDNTIIVIEGGLLAPIKKKFEKVGATILEYKSSASGSSYDPFKINAALAARDKKLVWVLLTEATRQQIAIEETVGILWWQLKTLRLAALHSSAAAAGIKPYPYDQAKKALRNFKPGEIEKLSRQLLTIYHDARLGKQEMSLGLEEWVLRL